MISLEKNAITSLEDHKTLQNKINNLDLVKFLKEFYFSEKIKNPRLMDLHSFLSRNLRASKAVIINEDKQLFPKKELTELNGGGDLCVVCSIPFRANYVEMLQEQIKGLKETGFKGYHLAYFGEYPNPTGQELKFAAVPYAFKIFAIREAALKGFDKVIWLDSAYVPQQNLQFLEQLLNKSGAIYTNLPPNGFKINNNLEHLPNRTKDILEELTGVDATKVNYVVAALMAFNTKHYLFEEFIRDYYYLVEHGYPFISFNPEEYVISAIIGQKKYKEWYDFNYHCKIFSLLNNNLKGGDFGSLFRFIQHPKAREKIW